MSHAHLAIHFPGFDQLRSGIGPTQPLAANSQPAQPMHTASPSLQDQFNAKVADYQQRTSADYAAAWEACKSLYPELWNGWQGAANEAKTLAANDAARASAAAAPTASEATTEFNRQVQAKMQSAGVNYGEAWSLVQQTQPRLYARMMGNAEADRQLAGMGHSEPATGQR